MTINRMRLARLLEAALEDAPRQAAAAAERAQWEAEMVAYSQASSSARKTLGLVGEGQGGAIITGAWGFCGSVQLLCARLKTRISARKEH